MTAQPSWISDLSPTTGQGNGEVAFRAAPNPLPTGREGTIVVNDQVAAVSQEAATCHYEVQPVGQNVPAGGGTGQFVVVAPGECPWTVAAAESWITVTSSPSGVGNGTVSFGVEANSGGPRSGTVTVESQTFTVNQDGGSSSCAYTLDMTIFSVPATAGTGSVTVTTSSGCTWTATSHDPWLSVTGGGTGSGSGTTTFDIQANTGAARLGTLTVAGQTVTVNQASASGCTYTLDMTTFSAPATASTGSVTVTTASGCAWTATSHDPWLIVTGGGTGSGSGTTTFDVQANTGAARSGTLTVAGLTVTVNQATGLPSCIYTLDPTSFSVSAVGSAGTVMVSTGPSCSWTAASNDSWLVVTAGAAGTGNGSVSFDIDPNPGSARSGTLTIAGQTVLVHQSSGPSCTYTLDATSLSVSAAAGTGTVTVSARPGCTWSARSNDAWITITAGTAGDGDGTVTFDVDANTGAARSGTLTVAGQTVSVNQGGV